MDKKIRDIRKQPPDLLEREIAGFISDTRVYLFRKKKNFMDLLLISSWIFLTLALVARFIFEWR